MRVTIDQMIACASREIKMRKRVYLGEGVHGGGKVGKGTMTKEAADLEIECMQSILNHLLSSKLESANEKKTVMVEEWAVIPRDEYQNENRPIAVKMGYIGGLLSQITEILPAAEKSGKMEFTIPIPIKTRYISEVAFLNSEYFTYKQLKVESTRDKIAIFCVAFKTCFDTDYKVRPKDAKIWKEEHGKVPAPIDLVDFYMRCTDYPIAGPKSIRDYLRHYDSIIQLKERAEKDKSDNFPGYFDKGLLDRLAKSDSGKYQKYRTHLRAIGYERKQNPTMGEVWLRK